MCRDYEPDYCDVCGGKFCYCEMVYCTECDPVYKNACPSCEYCSIECANEEMQIKKIETLQEEIEVLRGRIDFLKSE